MVKTIIDIALNLDLTVIAGGIEEEAQLAILMQYNCHIGQGYLFSKPVNPVELEKLLKKN